MEFINKHSYRPGPCPVHDWPWGAWERQRLCMSGETVPYPGPFAEKGFLSFWGMKWKSLPGGLRESAT